MALLPQHLHIHTDPVAAADAIVSAPQVRFSVLSPQLIRLEYAPDEVFEDRPSQAIWFRAGPVPDFDIRRDGDHVEIETDALLLRYHATYAGFTPDSLSITLKDSGLVWRYGDEPTRNLRGTYRTLDAIDGPVPLEPGLLSRDGWSVLDDSEALIFNEEHWLWPRGNHPDARDLYFFGHGRDYHACLRDYTGISGATPLLPRYVLGNWWSRYYEYTQDEITGLMQDFAAHDIPLSVCILDMDWHITDTGNESSGWTGYSWNRDLFPDPAALIAFFHEQGLRTALNLHPADGIYPHEDQYANIAKRLGIDPESGERVPFDIANPTFANAYLEELHHPHEAIGVDFWWMDWQQGSKSAVQGLDPLWWLNHLHFYDLARKGDKRPFIFSRWGGYGNHRYPIGFSGDAVISWESLNFQPHFTATAANVAYGWWSHDIGGHDAGIETPEIYTRWIQYGVFSPIMRIHSSKNNFSDRRPWKYERGTLELVREAMQLRHALIPYLYTMSWRSMTDALIPIRPMYHDYADEDAAYVCPSQYCFGTELVAAPFTQPMGSDTGLSRQVVWLPEGRWYDFFSGQIYAGDSWHALYDDLDRIPVFAKAGAIVPLGPRVGWGGVDNPRTLDIQIFAGADGAFTLYEDDGISTAYREGAYCLTRMTQTWGENHLRFNIAPAEGDSSMIPSKREIKLTISGITHPDTVACSIGDESQVVEWNYDDAQNRLMLTLASVPVGAGLQVDMSAESGSLLAEQDKRAETVYKIIRRFPIHMLLKARLYAALKESDFNPDTLADFAADLSDNQMRALCEVLYGAGFHWYYDVDAGDRVVLWNNHADSRLTYRLEWGVHLWDYQSEGGDIPRFKVFEPPLHPQRIDHVNDRPFASRWRVSVDYDGTHRAVHNREVVR